MKDILTNSSEIELKKQVDEKFENIDALKQGGITYLEFLLDKMFCMINDVVTAFQKFLKTFAEDGLSKKYERMCQRLLKRKIQ